jgi:4-amino-4-deoxy-L-arabinose transferase-like glycosyltransferase
MKYKTIFIHILTDIRFWILVSVCLRFECLLSPPIMWRETLTASIARNFLEIDNNIFYPRVDIGGERTGIIAGEFPFYNYLIYLLYKIFGYANWYGRPLNILITAWGALAFHSIVKRMLGESIAFYATIFFTFSIMFPFSHRIMPDTIAVSLALIGVYYGWRWLEANSVMYLVLSFIFVALGLLNKMPAFCVVWLLGFPLLQPHFSIRGRKILVFSSTIATLLMVVWYFLWVPYLLKTYDYQLFWTTTFTESWTKWGEHYDELWRRLHTNLFGNALTFFLAIMGVGTFLARKPKPLVWMMAGYFLTYLYFILKTGHVFPTHDYYTIPIAPLAAIMAGYGLETLTDKQYLFSPKRTVYISQNEQCIIFAGFGVKNS